MPEQVDVNGVTFTPEKVVDLDSFAKQPPVETPKADGGEPAKVEPPVETPKVEPPPKVDPPAGDPPPVVAPPKEEEGDEIILEYGDEKVPALEFMERYDKLKEEYDALKGDEFLQRFSEYYLGGGSPAEFLQKSTVKWTEIPDLDVIKAGFNADPKIAKLDQETRELLFERKLAEEYGMNPDGSFDEGEDTKTARAMKALMKRDAEDIRTSKIEEQKKYLLPKEKVATPQQKADPKAEREALLKDKDLQRLVKDKVVPVGDGMSFPVEDPLKVVGMMADVNQFWGLFRKVDGSIDKEFAAKVFAFALNPKKYEDHILGLGKDLGSESYLKEQRNTVDKSGAVVIDKTTDTETPMVVNGKIVSKQHIDGLGKAFAAAPKR
jgi:hypothetical protein